MARIYLVSSDCPDAHRAGQHPGSAGLGDDPIFRAGHPWVFLTTTAGPEVAARVCRTFGLRHKPARHEGRIHLFKHACTGTHKDKALDLFFAGLAVLEDAPDSCNLIGQVDVLRLRMQSGNLLEPDEEASEDLRRWTPAAACIVVPAHIALYLSHAGIAGAGGAVTREHSRIVLGMLHGRAGDAVRERAARCA